MEEVINILKKRRIQTQQAQRASLQEAQQAQAAQQAQQPKPQARQQKPAGMNIYAMAFASRRLLKRNKRRRRSIVTCWTYTNNTRIYMHSDCSIYNTAIIVDRTAMPLSCEGATKSSYC